MFLSHGQNYFIDAVAFTASIIPVALLIGLVALSLLEDSRRRYRAGRRRKFYAQHFASDPELQRVQILAVAAAFRKGNH